MQLNEKKYDAKKEPKREFAFSQEFPNEIVVALKAFDRVFKELTSLSNGKIAFNEEYGVVNNLYKFRYITPNDIATYVSNLIKVIKSNMIHPHVNDLQKFSVVCAKQFVQDHGGVPIEHSSIYGLYNYTTDNMTLRDLLVLCENDFYHTTVVSKFEMQERVKVMKKDYQTIADMHFNTNVMKIVDSLPKLITQTDFNELRYEEQKAVQTFIEEFILFTIMLNTIIMSNMIFFCVPKSTYDTKYVEKKEHMDSNTLLDQEEIDQDGVITEAVSEEETKPIYIVLTEGTELVSDKVKQHTRSRYSHSGLSFDDSLHHVYSFGMMNPKNEETSTRNGFRMDDMFSNHHKGMRFTVFVAFVSNEKWDIMKQYADHVKNAPKTKYSLHIIWRQLWNDNKERKSDTIKKNEDKEVCSTFVNSILKSAGVDLTKKVLPSPADFEASMLVHMSQFNMVFSGTSDDFDTEAFRTRVREFRDKNSTRKLAKGDVITECCLLKTNNARHTSKIPFDINMRNIVLQDMHPKFKDTIAAIEYITKDTRSPFAQLIYRYSHPSKVSDNMDGVMICKMFINDPFARCGSYDEYENLLHQADFHTDVCWLDRIAFGNSFLDGNYRDDAVGNEHRHPVKQTLETLYHMFSERELKTKEELCDHVLKIARIMQSIIEVYGSNGLYNWELVRDILAVLGEIMTRSLIKLYDMHMILVVSDNMDDVDAPGYMYTEAAVATTKKVPAKVNPKQDISFFKKSDKSEITLQNDVTSTGLNRIIVFCKKLVNRFVAWVQNVLSKLGLKFSKDHTLEKKFIEKNENLNEEIMQAIHDGSFRPKVKNWPIYKIRNLNFLLDTHPLEVFQSLITDSTSVGHFTVDEIKNVIYPKELAAMLTKHGKSVHQEYALMDEQINVYDMENDIFFQEAVSPEGGRPVFVYFELNDTRHSLKSINSFYEIISNIIWKGVHDVTQTDAFHAGISMEPSLKHGYSYAFNMVGEINRKLDPKKKEHDKEDDMRGKRRNGFVIENMGGQGIDKTPTQTLLVYATYLSNEAADKLEKFINTHIDHQEETKYDMKAIFNRAFAKKGGVHDNDFKWVCSSFTNACLVKAGVYDYKTENPAPGQIIKKLQNNMAFTCVYLGRCNGYDPDDAVKQLNNLLNDPAVDYADKRNTIIGEKLNMRQLSKNAEIIRNFYLFDNKEPTYLDTLSVEAFANLIKNLTLNNAGDKMEKALKDRIKELKKLSASLKDLIRNLEEDVSHYTTKNVIDQQNAASNLNHSRARLNQFKTLLQALNEIVMEYEMVVANDIIRDFYRINYTLYRDTVTAYQMFRGKKPPKFVDTTINEEGSE